MLRLTSAAVVLLAAAAAATTWFPVEVTCPLCETTNEFNTVGSWGTYIYDWPSKYELVYWPYTDGNVLYSCWNCKLTCFMSDFDDVPPEKSEAFRAALAEVDFGGEYASYAEIPMSARLAAAEKVYAEWDRGDDFWCHFYRLLGYHCAAEGLEVEAAAARGKALALAEGFMEDEGRAGERKEFLMITGAMRYLRGDVASARDDFEEALTLTYENAELEAKRNENYDEYLTSLLQAYVEKIDTGGEG
ncbi:MAG: hypothetical protein JSU81_07025 [Candidatus Coatesbacteria bacterium]|nr:MAG: hypothetical protein JSU81_07025 [Candidatus Coatesbacteria bacterium]